MNLKRTYAAAAVLAVGAMVMGAGDAAASPNHGGDNDTDYYLSLGDSLAVGFQPDASGVGRPTDNGFDRDLLPGLQLIDAVRGRSLRLDELGCPGESTTTMINAGSCPYSNAASQLDAATTFLARHQGHVPLVTITIGANDVENCASATGIDLTCVQQGLAAIQANLPTIVGQLKKAAQGTDTKFVGLNEYDPFLAAYLQGTAGQELARESVTIVDRLNGLLADAYGAAGFETADVASAFQTDDFTDETTLPGAGQVPVNVANICALTFECTPAPVGPNIHPQDSGYDVMAKAVAAKL